MAFWPFQSRQATPRAPRSGGRGGIMGWLRRGPAVRGKYDAAQTTPENSRHWANADQLSADAALTWSVRHKLRTRSRYEAANNCYAKGLVLSAAIDAVGTGPSLQVLSDNPVLNTAIEKEFRAWAKAVKLPRKLRTMRKAKCESGEVFAVFCTNRGGRHPVKLDLRLIEADQVATPDLAVSLQTRALDGIVLDEDGNPVEYHLLKTHPGAVLGTSTLALNTTAYDRIPAADMLHWFDEDRPSQHRGVPETTPMLPLLGQLRRFTLAVVAAAEEAARHAGILYTDAPPSGEAAEVDPDTLIDLEPRMLTVVPEGWKLGQMQAEQPTTTYGEFKAELLIEMGRARLMPRNVITGDSSRYNYSSGRLDNQVYQRAVAVERADLEAEILDRILARWLEEASLVPGLLPPEAILLDVLYLEHAWHWPGFGHVDPTKEASADDIQLKNNTTTLADVYAAQGGDWETKLRQRAREIALEKELGIAPAPGGAPGTDPDDGEMDSEDEDATEQPDSSRRPARRG